MFLQRLSLGEFLLSVVTLVVANDNSGFSIPSGPNLNHESTIIFPFESILSSESNFFGKTLEIANFNKRIF